jgi:hypothetical protein
MRGERARAAILFVSGYSETERHPSRRARPRCCQAVPREPGKAVRQVLALWARLLA